MRISSAILLAATLSACGSQTDTQVLANVEAQQSEQATEEGRVNCATGGSTEFKRICSFDRENSPRGLLLTLRNPDGSFHRLLVTEDGRGVIAADGAEKAQVAIVRNDEIEVSLGGDSYRLPATVKAPK